MRFKEALGNRLAKFSLQLEQSKTRLVEFGRFSHKHAKEREKKKETIYFLGFTHFCTRNRKGNFMVGRKTEKSRFSRSVSKITDNMRKIRHCSKKDQVSKINEMLRGHYNYYGIGGNKRALIRLYDKVEKFWWKMLCSRCRKGYIKWDIYNEIKKKYPILRPRIRIPMAA